MFFKVSFFVNFGPSVQRCLPPLTQELNKGEHGQFSVGVQLQGLGLFEHRTECFVLFIQ